jgi:hypothetical protein
MSQGQDDKAVCIQVGIPAFQPFFRALNKSKSCYIFKLRFRHLVVTYNIIRINLSTHS